MTSRVRLTTPPASATWQVGQASRACTTCSVATARRRAKLVARGRRGRGGAGAGAALDLWPGMPLRCAAAAFQITDTRFEPGDRGRQRRVGCLEIVNQPEQVVVTGSQQVHARQHNPSPQV